MDISAVSFNYKNDGDKMINYGFIAEDMINKIPELVSYDNNRALMISY